MALAVFDFRGTAEAGSNRGHWRERGGARGWKSPFPRCIPQPWGAAPMLGEGEGAASLTAPCPSFLTQSTSGGPSSVPYPAGVLPALLPGPPPPQDQPGPQGGWLELGWDLVAPPHPAWPVAGREHLGAR